MKKLVVISLLAFAILSGVIASTPSRYACKQWEVLDISFTAKHSTDNPLAETFDAIFISGKGQTMKIPGFYNDNNTWIIRFCPSSAGKWTFTTSSSIPELAGKNGTIEVSGNTDQSQHGPVALSGANPQKFAYADGTPYFAMAYEMDWLFALDATNNDGIPRTESIISAVAENGFNQVVMNVYAYDANWGERDKIDPRYNFAKPKVFPFGGNNENPDYSTLNIRFFQHLDRVISYLDKEGIVAHLMIYVWNKNVNWPEPGSPADNMYFDYVIKRYQAYPNLIWDISKEALAYGHNDMSYITRRIDRLRRLDGYRRLVTVHDYAYCSAFPGKVDFISVQDWQPDIYDAMLNILDTYRNQPVLNIEHGGYEKTMHSIFNGSYTDPLVCLDRNYKCLFAGTYSTYYWQNTSWYEVVWNPFSLPASEQPHYSYYKNLVSLFEKYDFNTLKPARLSFTTYCLTDNTSTFMFYLPSGMISLNGNAPMLKGKTVSISWFDPLTGNYYDGGSRTLKGTWLGIPRDEKITSPVAIAIIRVM